MTAHDSHPAPGRDKYLLLAAIFVTVVTLDQLTKYQAVARLTTAFEHHNRQSLAERVAGFYAIQNLDNEPYDAARVDHRLPAKTVVEGYWSHKYVENPGAAWGLLSSADERWRTPFFHLVSLAALIFIVAYYRKLERDQRLLAIAFSLVLGGALGNYLDRLVRGYVIDFVDWHWRNQPGMHWPTFNLADAAISVGLVLMLADSVFQRKEVQEELAVSHQESGVGSKVAATDSET